MPLSQAPSSPPPFPSVKPMDIKPMDATTCSVPRQSPCSSSPPPTQKASPPAESFLRSIPMPLERGALLDATPPSEYPPLLSPFSPDDASSAALEVLPLPKRHRGLQQTCSAPRTISQTHPSAPTPPSPTSCSCTNDTQAKYTEQSATYLPLRSTGTQGVPCRKQQAGRE